MNNQEKLAMSTKNLAEEKYKALIEMFPNAITETIDENGTVIRSIDSEVLAQEINTHVVTGKEERYQFTWPDKKKSVLLANAPIAATLRPCREESVDFDNTENLYIEGDNLDVLKLLRETYLNRVKMIYIDPPYNTGKDFIYEDDFREETGEFLKRDQQYDEQGNRLTSNFESNGRFHTDWLNMMYPRLRVARDLLRDDGVIFISIDDNEVENLKKICNETFGEKNFVAEITLLCNPKGRSQDKFFAKNHEYILIYSKSALPKGYFSIDKEFEQIDKEYPEEDEFGKYRLIELRNTHREFGRHNRKNLFYPIYFNKITNEVSIENIQDFIEIEPIWEDGYEGCWTWDKNKAKKDINLLKAKKIQNGSWKIYRKSYAENSKRMLKTIMLDKSFYTEKGQAVFNSLFSTKEKIFQSPKSIEMIKMLLKTITNKNDIIFDFFSGSASTAHAVVQLNSEDAGNRKFIMVQIPEETDEKSEANKAGYKNICEIGKERIRRAGVKIQEESGLLAHNLDVGFRVLKLDSSNMKDVYYNPEEYAQMGFNLENYSDNIKPDRTEEDLLFQVMLDLGIPLSAKIEQNGKVFFVNGNYLIAYFDRVDSALITEIAKREPYYAVFRDSSFANDSAMINVEQIFNTYSPSTERRVL